MIRRSLLLLLFIAAPAAAESPAPDPSKLTFDRIFASQDFVATRVAPLQWLEGGTCTTLQASKNHPGAQDIVRSDARGKTEILVAAEKLVPPGAKQPLAIDGYQFSQDLDLVLIYTNAVKVWRENTRGDYWTFRRSSGQLAKIGAAAQPSSLMFAKLSPDGTRVGYVRENNLFVEPAAGGAATQLTTDGSAVVINGTFDWVYEEEFNCRDGWRWSQGGQQIAYWQLDTTGVKTFTLINNTAANYPVLKTFA